jgi:M6 family metalloprotease-like protein
MTSALRPFLPAVFGFTSLLAVASSAFAADEGLEGYRNVRDAVTAQIQAAKQSAEGLTGYLGIVLGVGADGLPVVEEVGAGSPAQAAHIEKGDVVVSIGGVAVKTPDAARNALQSKAPGDEVTLSIRRGGKTIDVSATLGATSRPIKFGERRAVMGVRVGPGTEMAGLTIISLTKGKPAAEAGLRLGDVILKVNGSELSEALSLTNALMEKAPGDSVTLLVRRKTEELEKTITLVADETASALPPESRRILNTWKKDVYRMAVICVEYPDVKHNAKVEVKDWENAFFSRGTYNTVSATGQPVFGSMNDYYQEQSCGKLRVEGKVFDWIEVKKKRADYNQGTSATVKAEFLNEAIDAVLARDGKDALDGFDGLAFIYAGERFPTTNRGSLYWAHRSSVTHARKPWPYVIVAEGGEKMGNISTMCHETGHILGLPDLYARPENPGSEGVGSWCAMSNQSRDGRPQHFSAWCKEQLGWLQPVVVDPTVKQKLILGPVEGSVNECLKVLVKPDASEYFLLENRRKTGFDKSLPAEGLLIWHIVANRPVLEESHGVAGPFGPRTNLPMVPYPSKANNSFTPFTTPSSRSQLGGGPPVFITNIRKLEDGRVAFEIGYEFQ